MPRSCRKIMAAAARLRSERSAVSQAGCPPSRPDHVAASEGKQVDESANAAGTERERVQAARRGAGAPAEYGGGRNGARASRPLGGVQGPPPSTEAAGTERERVQAARRGVGAPAEYGGGRNGARARAGR